MGQRFLVAGGGGGGACYRTSDPNAGGNAGGSTGSFGQQAGGTPDSNTRPGSTNGCAGNNSTNCPFGTPSAASYNDSTGGGGGGWFSGMGGQDTRVTGAGGSSFVYGFNTNVNNRCTVSSSDITYVSNGMNNAGGGSSASSAGSARITVVNVEL